MNKIILGLLVSVPCFAEPPVLIADKTNATITVYYPDTQTSITEPALFGRNKSNELDMTTYDYPVPSDNVTPAGTFPLTKIHSWRLGEDMLVYIKGKAAVGAIHPLWTGNPDQRRIERLKSSTPDDNRITGGCINVDSNFFYNTLSTLPPDTKLTILPE